MDNNDNSGNNNRKEVPKTLEELNALATVEIDECIPLEIYIHSADLLIRQARIYNKEGNEEQAYVYYLKFINLVLKKLDQRPGFDRFKNKIMMEECVEALDEVEVLKPTIVAIYESYKSYQQELLKESEKEKERQRNNSSNTNTNNNNNAIPANNTNMNMNMNMNMNNHQMQEYLINNNNNNVNYYYYQQQQQFEPSAPSENLLPSNGSTYHEIEPMEMDWEPEYKSYNVTDAVKAKEDIPPPLPPKIRMNESENQAPPLPPKIACDNNSNPFVVTTNDNNNPFIISTNYNDENNPFIITNNNSNITTNNSNNNNESLRILKVPKSLHHKFLQVAHLNTLENIETCGILSGILENNELVVTTLIIPKQSGTSDTCATVDEESIFKYQEKLSLLTLGWIHTHPSQTCFLSSVDLHTHCSYQLMLPEAIAIVCAPKHEPDYGVFRLTHPEGLRTISSCRASQGFHIHENTNQIYKDITEQGHVKTIESGSLDIIDLR